MLQQSSRLPTACQLRSASARFRMPAAWQRENRAPLGQLAAPAAEQASPRLGVGLRDPRLAPLEVVLFLAREPLSSRKLCQHASLADATEARTLVRQLNEWYDRTGRAFRVEEVAGGYQLLTRPQFSTWLRRLSHVPRVLRLSAPALETLAAVAYRQPVLRAEIEAIRGVNCGEILKQLMERGLVRITGRSDELGRPYLYGTTSEFLRMCGLRHLDELPRSEQWATPRGTDSNSVVDTLHSWFQESGRSTQEDVSVRVSTIQELELQATREADFIVPRDEPSLAGPRRAKDEGEDEDEQTEEEEDDEFDDDEEEEEDDEFEDDEEDEFDDEEFDEDFDEEDEDFDEDEEEWEEVDDEEDDDLEDDDEEEDDDWGDDEE